MSSKRLIEAKRPFGGGLRAAARERRAAAVLPTAGPSGGASMLAVPDLLHLEPRLNFDEDAVQELLELSFLGREAAKGLDRALGDEGAEGDWDLELFARDLFVPDLIRDTFGLAIDGLRYPINEAFLFQVLSAPPTTVEGVAFRQRVLRELEDDDEVRRRTYRLYHEVAKLLAMFKTPEHARRLDIDAFRLDLLKQARQVIDRMADDFRDARSGLHRLHEAAVEIQEGPQYRRLLDLLDFESRQSTLAATFDIGADGELKHLHLHDLAENKASPFYTPLWRRWWTRLRAFVHGYRLSPKVIVQQVLRQVFQEIAPALVPLVQVMGHLEVYLTSIGFRRQMEAAGLSVCLAEVAPERPVRLDGLFNPLLLAADEPPVPCDIHAGTARPITLVTGPNSGGKTRLLQALGLAQLLGQSGLYVPAAHAELPLVRGLFVSLVETETAHQAEGRLGREMMRIRRLFSTMGSPSVVILDELCSGTNPQEGIEIFALVLRLLERLGTVAFVSTHFLEFATGLEAERPVEGLEFLRVELDDDLRSTYQFVPGVAESSLAAATAERLGVTFDALAQLIDERKG